MLTPGARYHRIHAHGAPGGAKLIRCSPLLVGLVLAGPAPATRAAPPPVLLELFTSQGCSSCPPADALLRELARDGVDGIPVIALSFHVDYWNRLGWTDPFSSPEASARQEAYARAMKSARIYTPQIVVDGRRECVGSDRACVRRAVRDAAARTERWTLELRLRLEGSRLHVEVAPPSRHAAPGTGGARRLVVALTESGLVTSVVRGENASRRLENDHVVRAVARAAVAAPGTVSFDLDPSWDRERLTVAAFLEDPSTLAVDAAAAAPLD